MLYQEGKFFWGGGGEGLGAVLGDSKNVDYRFRARFLITYPTIPLTTLCVKVEVAIWQGGGACEMTKQTDPKCLCINDTRVGWFL